MANLLSPNFPSLSIRLDKWTDHTASQLMRCLSDIQRAFQNVANLVNVQVANSGVTASRPTTQLVAGQMFFDTTLGYPIWWSVAHSYWVNASGTGPQ